MNLSLTVSSLFKIIVVTKYINSELIISIFSFQEMGIHDGPAKIDYILKRTGQDQLYISALSLGTTVFFIMASVKPEYNSKIRMMAAEGPVAKITINHGSIATTRLSEVLSLLFSGLSLWKHPSHSIPPSDLSMR